ncbi:DNA/RNA polymerase [Mycena kentingensis (nom. inval.)]|nr:DNA/RNA polymerase [Mycena kentingensis (nom. inval.)]
MSDILGRRLKISNHNSSATGASGFPEEFPSEVPQNAEGPQPSINVGGYALDGTGRGYRYRTVTPPALAGKDAHLASKWGVAELPGLEGGARMTRARRLAGPSAIEGHHESTDAMPTPAVKEEHLSVPADPAGTFSMSNVPVTEETAEPVEVSDEGPVRTPTEVGADGSSESHRSFDTIEPTDGTEVYRAYGELSEGEMPAAGETISRTPQYRILRSALFDFIGWDNLDHRREWEDPFPSSEGSKTSSEGVEARRESYWKDQNWTRVKMASQQSLDIERRFFPDNFESIRNTSPPPEMMQEQSEGEDADESDAVYNAVFDECFPATYKLELREKLMSAKQGNSKVRDFVRDIESLANRFRDITERHLQQIFWTGLRQHLRLHLIGEGHDPENSTLEQMAICAAREEKKKDAYELEQRLAGKPSNWAYRDSYGGPINGWNGQNNGQNYRKTNSNWSRGRGQQSNSNNSNPHGSGAKTETAAPAKNAQNGKSEGGRKRERPPRMDKEKRDRLRAESRCFNCEEVGHESRNCPERKTAKAPKMGASAAKFKGAEARGTAARAANVRVSIIRVVDGQIKILESLAHGSKADQEVHLVKLFELHYGADAGEERFSTIDYGDSIELTDWKSPEAPYMVRREDLLKPSFGVQQIITDSGGRKLPRGRSGAFPMMEDDLEEEYPALNWLENRFKIAMDDAPWQHITAADRVSVSPHTQGYQLEVLGQDIEFVVTHKEILSPEFNVQVVLDKIWDEHDLDIRYAYLGTDADFEILWSTGDITWAPFIEVKHLVEMDAYCEAMGVAHARKLPARVQSEVGSPHEATRESVEQNEAGERTDQAAVQLSALRIAVPNSKTRDLKAAEVIRQRQSSTHHSALQTFLLTPVPLKHTDMTDWKELVPACERYARALTHYGQRRGPFPGWTLPDGYDTFRMLNANAPLPEHFRERDREKEQREAEEKAQKEAVAAREAREAEASRAASFYASASAPFGWASQHISVAPPHTNGADVTMTAGGAATVLREFAAQALQNQLQTFGFLQQMRPLPQCNELGHHHDHHHAGAVCPGPKRYFGPGRRTHFNRKTHRRIPISLVDRIEPRKDGEGGKRQKKAAKRKAQKARRWERKQQAAAEAAEQNEGEKAENEVAAEELADAFNVGLALSSPPPQYPEVEMDGEEEEPVATGWSTEEEREDSGMNAGLFD